jgi:type IV fimbrial biogenesis protein FimT
MPSNQKDYQDMREKPSKQRGFTLMELMVTLSIAGIMLSIAIPNFTSTIKGSRITTQVNEFVTSMNFIRSEAVKRGVRVSMCKSSDGATCVTTGDWAQGWIVFTNQNDDANYDGAPETILKIQGATQSQIAVVGNSLIVNIISYKASGEIVGSGTVTFCDDRVAEVGKKIVLSNTTGRPRIDTYTCT